MGKRPLDPRVLAEIQHKLEDGMEQLTVQEWDRRLREIGYRFNRAGDCKSMSKHLTGEHAGFEYPEITTWVDCIEDGLNFAAVGCKRPNFEQFKALRNNFFAVDKGCILWF